MRQVTLGPITGLKRLQRSLVGHRPQTWDSVARGDYAAMLCSLLTIGCWLMLYRWYSVRAHVAMPGFSFDKLPGHLGSWILRYTALLLVALILLYVANYCVLKRAKMVSARMKLATIVTIAGSGLLSILIYPVTAIDVFYYLAELKLAFFYHQNPYLVTFVPAHAADPFARFGWPLHVPLAYGPAWLLLSWPATLLGGFRDLSRLLLAYKALSFAILMLCGAAIYRWHDDEKSRWLGVYAFLANPLVLFEAVGNAHNDVMMTLCLLAAVLALKRRSWLVLPLLAAAALVKVFAVALIPVFGVALLRQRWSLRDALRSALAALALASAIVAPCWAHGRMLGGMLRAMDFANNLVTASLLSYARTYLGQHHAPPGTIAAVRPGLGLLLAILVALLTWRFKRPERTLAHTLLLLYTLAGSIQPWYWIPVLGLLALTSDRLAFGYLSLASALGLVIYLVDVWARFDSGLSFAQRHVLGTVLLNLPIVAFLGLDLWKEARRHAGVTKGSFRREEAVH